MTKNAEIALTINDLHYHLLDAYKETEKELPLNYLGSNVSYISPVNFTESMSNPRHRWFPYKEGFSPSFVMNFLNKHGSRGKGIVLDPFAGVGTTPIVASNLGYDSIGMDVSPLAIFVAKTKTLNLNSNDIKEFNKIINNFGIDRLINIYPAPDNKTVVSYYDPEYLDALLRVRAFIETIDNNKIRSLFFLAYLARIEDFSTHRKAGNGVKRKTNSDYNNNLTAIESVKISMKNILNQYIEDIQTFQLVNPPSFINKSCLDSNSYQNIQQISNVITSPPYANCFDYSKIYLRELWFGDFFKTIADHKQFRNLSVRSHVHATWEERHKDYSDSIIEDLVRPILESQKLWSNKIPLMLSGYFKDLSRLLDLISNKSIPGARVGFVVSNSFYGGIPIATDILLSRCGKRFGFNTIAVDIYRGIIPSSQQYKKIADKYFMRESLVILEKS